MTPAGIASRFVPLAGLLVLSLVQAQTSGTSRIEAAFQKFWSASSPIEAGKLADDIGRTGVTFDEAFTRLKAGRTYTAQTPGVVFLKNVTSDGIEHNFAVTVPANYDPSRRYQIRFQLHGGVGARNDNKPRNNGEIGALAGAEQFYVLPYSWDKAPWWGEDQILNLNAIVDALKRTYNIDENRVLVAGVSDGATGAYYIAMRETTPFASFLPLNGFLMVLGSHDIDDGRIFPNNLRNKPLFVVNGGRDRLYPIRSVEPYTRHLMAKGVTIDYHPQPEGEHNTRWWPEIKDPFEKFAADHPRDPHPAMLTWETADASSHHLSHNRAHWLIIDELGAVPGEAKDLPEVNEVARESGNEQYRTLLFGNPKTSGRVDLVRESNEIRATTKGVKTFTLLISPDRFNLTKAIRVVVNGKEVFNGLVKPDLRTLLKWAARDNDRTMLYAAELKIKLTR